MSPIKAPTLSLPFSYFHQEDLQGGFVNPQLDSDDFTTWEKAQFDSGYRSRSTTTITFIDFRNTDEALPDLSDEEEWTSLIDEMTASSSLYAAQHQAYGEMSKRYACWQYARHLCYLGRCDK